MLFTIEKRAFYYKINAPYSVVVIAVWGKVLFFSQWE